MRRAAVIDRGADADDQRYGAERHQRRNAAVAVSEKPHHLPSSESVPFAMRRSCTS
jgi:hypothetical protein